MSISYGHGVLTAKNLSDADYEYPHGKGLFVIIRNDTMNYEHYLESTGTCVPFGDLSVGYKKDEELLKKTFQIDETDKDQHNVLIGRNLHHKSVNSEAEKQFDGFMEKVKQKATELKEGQKDKPKFILFVLMSHGMANGVFLLGNHQSEKCCRKPDHKCEKTEPKCCEKNPRDCCREQKEKFHSQRGKCHERKVKEDIIEPIQEKFKGIPKIFIIQTCRGSKTGDLLKSKGGGTPPKPNPVDFIPRSADTIVLYPCENDEVSWVNNSDPKKARGSMLIYEFCNAIQNLGERLASVQPALLRMNQVDGQRPNLAAGFMDPNLQADVESAVGGWLTDVCRLTAVNVARRYMIEKVTYAGEGEQKKVNDREALTKAQPEVKSTLHSRVSCIKLMRTQIPNWGETKP